MHGARITLPRGVLVAALPRMLAEGQFAWGLAGKVVRPEGMEYVLPRLDVSAEPSALWRAPGAGHTPFVLIAGAKWRSPQAWEPWLKSRDYLASVRGLIVLDAEGAALGWVREDGAWEPAGEFNLPGQGMERIGGVGLDREVDTQAASVSERDSRFAGALSAPVLARLRELRYVLVGVSRVGTLVAHTLSRWGVKYQALVDPDVVEAHNADAGEFDPTLDEGMPKVRAVARAVGRLPPAGREIKQIAQPLLEPLAFSTARLADVLITCVDDDGARLSAAMLASSHLRVHLDIGVQVRVGEKGAREVGADIRLVVPGESSQCLCCLGGFAQHDALRRLAGFDRSPRPHWTAMRAGSLRTVNQIAAHLGLRLIERLASGEVSGSTWLRYEEAPKPVLREIVPNRPWSCPVCGTCHGIGDAVYEERDLRLRRMVRSIAGVTAEDGGTIALGGLNGDAGFSNIRRD